MRSCNCWPFSSCSGSTETSSTKTVTTVTKNGKTVITTKFSNGPTTVVTTSSEQTIQRPQSHQSSIALRLPMTKSISQNEVLASQATATTGHQFEKECLNEHNRVRALHGCPPLVLNQSMSGVAQNWANYLANHNTMKHSNGKFGENLYMCSGFAIDGKKAVESWYNEIKDYNFARGGFSMKTGHFTQVVWKSSKQLGVGVQRRGNSTWVVANYDPPGNFANSFQENVPRPLR